MLAFLVLSSLVLSAFAYPEGAPTNACDMRLPGHHVEAQEPGTSPYHLKVKNLTNGKYEITLKSDRGVKFMGFLLGALDSNNKYQGSFNEIDDIAKSLTCGSGKAATHTGRTEKSEVKLEWTKPASFKGPIKFVATVVKDYEHFWVDVTAPTVNVQ